MAEQRIADLEDTPFGPGRLLGAGGTAKVYEVEDGTPGARLITKIWTAPPPGDLDALTELIRLRSARDLEEYLDERACWPQAAALVDGEVRGFSAARASDEFYFDYEGASGTTRRLADLGFLLTPARYQLNTLGRVASFSERLALLVETADFIRTMHEHGVVIGDISPRNILYTLLPEPRMWFLDVDGFSIGARSLFGDLQTPGWTAADVVGEAEESSAARDILKFALLVLRLLRGDQLARDPSALILPPELREISDLIRVSLGVDTEARPSAMQWVGALRRALDDTPRGWFPYSLDGALPTLRTGLSIVLVGTEWLPRHGGLSQVNRSLGIAFAARGHRVTAMCQSVTADDLRDAARHGVSLVVPEIVGGEANLHICPPSMRGSRVDVVIGHDRFTGLYAVTQSRQNFPGSLLVIIAHTIPEEIEWLKERDGASGRAEHRQGQLRALCAEADIRSGIGPRLTRSVADMLHRGYESSPVIRLDPGLAEPLPPRPVGRVVGPILKCLLLGRAEDPGLKGLDLGAYAFAEGLKATKRPMRLVIRGAEPGSGDRLHEQLCRDHSLARGDVSVKEFNPDPETIRTEILSSTVLMMPSRGEGFGLVGLEAIANGTPVLVSSRSGLAELLFEICPDLAGMCVVQVDDDMSADKARWAEALNRIVGDPPMAFATALGLYDQLSPVLQWSAAAEQLERVMLTGRMVRRGRGDPGTLA